MKNINSYPDPWDLTYFLEVAKTGNLSRASEKLGVGQPALSLAIKRLETLLGVDLFIRRSRGMVMTESGNVLAKEASGLLAKWQDVANRALGSTTELRGRFRLGCHPSVAIYTLGPLLKKVYQNFPQIELELVHGLSRQVGEKIISGDIDFGLVINPVRHPDLVIKKLLDDQVGFWKSKNGLDDVLIYNPNLLQTGALLKKIQGKKAFKRTVTSDSLEVIAKLVESGLGTGILPGRIVGALTPDLVLQDRYPSYQDELALVYRHDLPSSAAVKAVLEVMRGLGGHVIRLGESK
ncbi:MAG: LysR family transcriptional regulator [Bdellovibrionales bacterium]|nr:LysR family transcriptional regulator [Bdellovibrionales bacterium]